MFLFVYKIKFIDCFEFGTNFQIFVSYKQKYINGANRIQFNRITLLIIIKVHVQLYFCSKMSNYQKFHVPIILQLILFVVSVHCNDSKNDQNVAKIDVFSIRNVNLSNIAIEILIQDWTKNPDCLIELNKIRNGLENSEKWAMKCKLNFFEIPSFESN